MILVEKLLIHVYKDYDGVYKVYEVNTNTLSEGKDLVHALDLLTFKLHLQEIKTDAKH